MTDAPAPRHDSFVTRRAARCAVLGPADLRDVRELWFLLHGYGQLAAEFVAGAKALDDGTRLLVAPEALSRFYDTRAALETHASARVGASWMTREDRLAEIDDQVHWFDLAWAHYRAAIGRDVPLTVLGFSQGAAAASRWVAHGAAKPVHLQCWGGVLGPELPLEPGSALAAVRCTLVCGDRDKYVPEERLAAECARLDAAGYRYELVRFAGGHRLDDGTLRRLAGAAP